MTSPTTSATTGTMIRAVVQDRYGTSDVWRLDLVPRPSPAAGQVLVRVAAAGLDRGTEHLMNGMPYVMRLGFGLRAPKNPVPGRDVAGTVESVGPGVTRFEVGDEVYGVAPGSFAEYAVAPEDKLAPKPVSLSFAQAAVVPISAGTALQALQDAGRVRAGQSVLVLGASGGVGSYAVQLAKAFGAEVTGVCSTANVEFVASLGADHVLDRERVDFADGARRYDLILDIAGNPSVRRLRRALSPGGTVVLVGGEDAGRLTGMGRQLRAAVVSLFVGERLVMFLAKERASDYERLAELVDAGIVTPALHRAYPLDQAPDAMRLLETGEVRGKVAVTL